MSRIECDSCPCTGGCEAGKCMKEHMRKVMQDKMAEAILDPLGKDRFDLFPGSASTVAQVAETTLTVDKMKEMLQELKESEPFYKVMTDKGYCPDNGWVLFLPNKSVNERYCDKLPVYVKVSVLLESPIVTRLSTIRGFGMDAIDWTGLLGDEHGKF